ncbi:MAG: Rieske (2Fe-2S) protein [Gammaproteobacteria bacterium]|nr:Rieske (2Fe-2S) protein [Gammaproteobacteria bacterium]
MDMTRVAPSEEIREGELFASRIEGTRILVSRVNGRICAVVDRCPHMGMSLARGKVEGNVVTCPWHNSRFDLCTGRNLDWVSAVLGLPMPKWTHRAIAMGKAPAPLTTLPCEERNGEVWVSLKPQPR